MDKLVDTFAELARIYGPNVVDAARGAVVIEAYSCLVSSIVCFIIAVVLIKLGRFLWRYESSDPVNEGLSAFFGGAAITVSLIFIAIGVWNWIDPWTWTAISNPDLYIAKKIFKL